MSPPFSWLYAFTALFCMRYVIFVMLRGASAGKDLVTQMQLYSWVGVIIIALRPAYDHSEQHMRFNLIGKPEHRV